jgi:hypothetical protein
MTAGWALGSGLAAGEESGHLAERRFEELGRVRAT